MAWISFELKKAFDYVVYKNFHSEVSEVCKVDSNKRTMAIFLGGGQKNSSYPFLNVVKGSRKKIMARPLRGGGGN